MSHNIFYAIIVSKMAYAISSWHGFLDKAQIAQINRLFKRAFKLNLSSVAYLGFGKGGAMASAQDASL